MPPSPAPRPRQGGSKLRRATAEAGDSIDSADALAATDRLTDLEHVADNAERAVTTAVLKDGGEMGAALSRSSWHAPWSAPPIAFGAGGHLLHQHVMADLSGSRKVGTVVQHRSHWRGSLPSWHPPEEIGAKAAILARVASAGVPVPPAFVLPIQSWRRNC